MLFGEVDHSLDAKSRLIIPAKFREKLGERFVMNKGLDNCLCIYSQEEWEKLDSQVRTLDMNNKDARAYMRYFYSGACECELDKQGRTVVPNNLREYANIEKDVTIVGVTNHIEVWNKDRWQELNGETDKNIEQIAENLFKSKHIERA